MALLHRRGRRHAFRFRRSKLVRAAAESARSTPVRLPNSLTRPARPPSLPDEQPTAKPWDAPRHTQVHERDSAGWDGRDAGAQFDGPSPAAQLLALFAEPGVTALHESKIAENLRLPVQDVRNLLRSLEQAGYLLTDSAGTQKLYRLRPDRKAELERLYVQTAQALGETQALAAREPQELANYVEEDEPRLPITAGILSLFLPGTGQLLNGDIGRAVLVFAIWALAVIAPHPAIIVFVRLYAGAEAFFNAKLRRLAQQRALQAAKERREQNATAAPALKAATPALPSPGSRAL